MEDFAQPRVQLPKGLQCSLQIGENGKKQRKKERESYIAQDVSICPIVKILERVIQLYTVANRLAHFSVCTNSSAYPPSQGISLTIYSFQRLI